MDSSKLKDLLWHGCEVEFEYGSKSYVVKMIDYRSTTEYSFGPKWSNKITTEYFDLLLNRHDFGPSLSEILKEGRYVGWC